MEIFKLFGTIMVNNDGANKSIDETNKKAEGTAGKFGNALKTAGKFGAAVVGAGAAAVTAVMGVTAATSELNGDLGRLKANASNMGFDYKGIEDGFKKVLAVTDEADSSVEGLVNLMQTDMSENQLASALDDLLGASIRFSDTLKFEGIADGLQETLATGKAIGPFAELLERSGVNLDTFNTGLAKAAANGDATNFALDQLSKLGLSSAYEEWKKMNPEMAKNQEVTADLQTEFAKLGQTLTPITTFFKLIIAEMLGFFNNSTLVQSGLLKITELFSNFSLDSFTQKFGFLGPYITSIIDTVKDYIINYITLIKTLWDEHGESIIAIVQRAFGLVQTVVQHVLNLVVPFIQSSLQKIKQFWDENGQQIITAVQNAFNFILSIIEFVMPLVLAVISTVWESIKNVINGALDIIMGLIKTFSGLFTGDFSKMWEGIKQLFGGAVEAIWGIINLSLYGRVIKGAKSFVKSLKDFFVNLGNSIKGTVKDFVNQVITWFNYFKNSGASIWDSIAATIKNTVKMFVSAVKNNFSGLFTNVKTTFNNIKNAITNPIETAKKVVKSVIDDIKGFFTGMKLKLPKIKMPSFSIKNWSPNPVDWVKAMPKLSINWNAAGGIFSKPTIFNTRAGLQGVGEAGPEAIIPLRKDVLADIGAGIDAAQSKDFSKIIELLTIIASKTGILQLNGRILGEEVDTELSTRQQLKDRGLAL